MSDESISAIEAATTLGGEEIYIDRRSHIDLGNLKDVIVIVKGSVVLFVRSSPEKRRHRIGIVSPGAVLVGLAPGVEIVPVTEAEVIQIPVLKVESLPVGSPFEVALCVGIGSTLAACGSALPANATLAIARSRCATELTRRGVSVIETSFARHMRRLVNVASARLAFPAELKSMIAQKSGDARELPDSRLPPVVRACMQIAQEIGCDVSTIPSRIPRDNTRRPEQIFAHVSGLGIRPVFLDPGWWNSGVGALLAFKADDQSAVAILPTAKGMMAYVHSAGATQGPIVVDKKFADQLSGTASQFHPTLSSNQSTLPKFLRFVIQDSAKRPACDSSLCTQK